MGSGIRDVRVNTVFFAVLIIATYCAVPPDVYAVEVGCFCTFIFASLMFVIGIGFTLLGKYQLGKKIWKLSLKRTVVITGFEVILLILVLIVLQTRFYLRVLTYLPFAFLLNYALSTQGPQNIAATNVKKKRLVMSALSSAFLPIAVQFMAWISMILSELITFKEVRV